MSTAFHLLADPELDGHGEFAREQCAYELDRAILDGTPGGAHAFVEKWGEQLRALLQSHDVSIAAAYREGRRHAA